MCGRFTLTADLTALQERFTLEVLQGSYTPSYNIAPGQSVMVVINAEGKQAAWCRWGLVPAWAKDPQMGHRLINARAETVADKPSFRRALRQRRCLVLADGFYEWRQRGKHKQPMYIGLHDHQPFAFAGLWEVWRDAQGAALSTCTIVTTTANTLLQPIHARMPVILPPTAEALWLDQRLGEPQQLLAVLVPYPAEEMVAYPVSSLVNAPSHNSPACIVPLPAEEAAC
jgi:putative SOS response-associated peptidase YedK